MLRKKIITTINTIKTIINVNHHNKHSSSKSRSNRYNYSVIIISSIVVISCTATLREPKALSACANSIQWAACLALLEAAKAAPPKLFRVS